MATDPLEAFHPAVATWFARRFPNGPTEAQAAGWQSIARGTNTLIAAPTGSGKTLAGFLVAIDACLRSVLAGNGHSTQVIYVSPLRALTVDVQQNLQQPLAEIAEIAVELGYASPDIRVAVRNGDTTQAARAAIVRDRPEIIVTTPESLYLLLTAQRGRDVISSTATVIVDEIHALARDKRGSHLALSLERLNRLVLDRNGRAPVRIGLSATQRPIETVARLLVGTGPDRSHADGSPACQIVDVGHRRALDISIVLPNDELGAVMTSEQLGDVVESIAEEIARHKTTLVFVNTRRMAERLAHLLAEHIGDDAVSAHHGSLSMQRRLSIEGRLRAGDLRAVVATASLELGIDVGPIDLVCQLGSPRAIATLLQRVGRAEHRLDGIPKGRIYPGTRDELVECVALLGAVNDGALDTVCPPVAPLDILAQQIVAECAAHEDGIAECELLQLVRSASPYSELSDASFSSVVELVSDGVQTGRGTRGAHLHRDRIHGVLRPRRGARLAAATSGGAIPELADYKVVLEPEGALVGTVHEDFAVEAMAGDVFLLGSMSWRVMRVEQGTVRVLDAAGAAPTVPFWLGESPGRTDELARAVSTLRELVAAQIASASMSDAIEAVRAWSGVGGRPAEEAVTYLATGLRELGVLPSLSCLVLERFFDDAGGMQLVVHSPYGARINRGLGLALRKRFCRSFDFELQAAASDDAIVLSLGPQHSFPLEEVPRYLSPATVSEVLIQALLVTPMFTSRWRWNLSRSLVSPRFRGSRHLPPAIQRMEADDLMAAIFPQLAACQENVPGPIEIPDHPIVSQTLIDCCTEAVDLEGLIALVGGIRSGDVRTHCRDTTEPSVLSHEILNGRPYTFLDDAPLEERRTRAVSLRRSIPLEAHDLSVLDPAIIAEVAAEVVPDPRNEEELHDLLLGSVLLVPDARFASMLEELIAAGRAMRVHHGQQLFWCATEKRSVAAAALADATFVPDVDLLEFDTAVETSDALTQVLRGQFELSGPLDVDLLAERLGIEPAKVHSAVASLQAEGYLLGVLDDKWCAKRIVARIHARQRDRLRKSYKPVTIADLMYFYLDWQHVAPGTRLVGTQGLARVIDQLQGIEIAVGAWEQSVLCARVAGYHAGLLDELALGGEVCWARLSFRSETSEQLRRSGATPSRQTPVTLARREHLPWLLTAARMNEQPNTALTGATEEIIAALEDRGALFFSDLCNLTARMPTQIAEGLWDGVARGLLTSDGFQAVRALLAGRYRNPSQDRRANLRHAPLRAYRASGPRNVPPAIAGGRWSLLRAPAPEDYEPDELAEAVALQLLERWGVVVREVALRESLAISWRDVLWALRRLEARGVARGGRFVAGPVGEQFATPEALERLRALSTRDREHCVVTISATDPLNLTGYLLPGPRVPAIFGQEITLRDGVLDPGSGIRVEGVGAS